MVNLKLKLSLTLSYFWLSIYIFTTIAAFLLYKAISPPPSPPPPPPPPRSSCYYQVDYDKIYYY